MRRPTTNNYTAAAVRSSGGLSAGRLLRVFRPRPRLNLEFDLMNRVHHGHEPATARRAQAPRDGARHVPPNKAPAVWRLRAKRVEHITQARKTNGTPAAPRIAVHRQEDLA